MVTLPESSVKAHTGLNSARSVIKPVDGGKVPIIDRAVLFLSMLRSSEEGSPGANLCSENLIRV